MVNRKNSSNEFLSHLTFRNVKKHKSWFTWFAEVVGKSPSVSLKINKEKYFEMTVLPYTNVLHA